jgi:hypothetical protein
VHASVNKVELCGNSKLIGRVVYKAFFLRFVRHISLITNAIFTFDAHGIPPIGIYLGPQGRSQDFDIGGAEKTTITEKVTRYNIASMSKHDKICLAIKIKATTFMFFNHFLA